MEYIIWKDNFNLGVKEIDEQHILFAGYINEIYNAIKSGNAESIIISSLDKLTNYSQVHFSAEEYMLMSINYPRLEIQQKQHALYISELTSIKRSFIGKTQTAQKTLLFLKDWFLHHIMTEDLKYVEFIK